MKIVKSRRAKNQKCTTSLSPTKTAQCNTLNPEPAPRKPSANELEVMKLRRRVQQLEQQERRRELQIMNQERYTEVRMRSPYKNDYEEKQALYKDFLDSEEEERERRERVRDMRELRKYVMKRWNNEDSNRTRKSF